MSGLQCHLAVKQIPIRLFGCASAAINVTTTERERDKMNVHCQLDKMIRQFSNGRTKMMSKSPKNQPFNQSIRTIISINFMCMRKKHIKLPKNVCRKCFQLRVAFCILFYGCKHFNVENFTPKFTFRLT